MAPSQRQNPQIEEYISRYRNGGSEPYAMLTKKVSAICRANLKGFVPMECHDRVKPADSLKRKLYSRDPSFVGHKAAERYSDRSKVPPQEKGYKDFEDIKRDMHDLAGVRLLLFNPHQDQWQALRSIIYKSFTIVNEQVEEWPARSIYPARPKTIRLLVRLKKGDVGRDTREGDVCEIQVMTTVLNAWREVRDEHLYRFSQPVKRERDLLNELELGVFSQENLLVSLWQEQQRG